MLFENFERRLFSLLYPGYAESRKSLKVSQDKRVVTDFRCLNMRIAKNQSSLSLAKRHVYAVRRIQMCKCYQYLI